MTPELQPLLFSHQKDWAAWLSRNHDKSPGVWLRLAKKASGIQLVSHSEALETALCHGWIDARKNTFDQDYWLQRFTPRGARSKDGGPCTMRPGPRSGDIAAAPRAIERLFRSWP